MNHSFKASIGNTGKCISCGYEEIMHTDKAVCESCPNIGPVEIYQGKIALCEMCLARDRKLAADNLQRIIDKREAVDNSIQVRTDIFNAEVVSINDLKKAIYDSDTPNKPYVLAQQLIARFKQYQTVVFELQEKVLEETTKQRSIQTYLNNLANELRKEEREALRISDLNYKPKEVKEIKSVKVKIKTFDKKEIREIAGKYNIPEYMLQMVVTSKNCTPLEAAESIKKSIEEAKNVT
jgi:predicted RNA-binding Zn-ribbon protein involved in translation (DUF1610 family)